MKCASRHTCPSLAPSPHLSHDRSLLGLGLGLGLRLRHWRGCHYLCFYCYWLCYALVWLMVQQNPTAHLYFIWATMGRRITLWARRTVLQRLGLNKFIFHHLLTMLKTNTELCAMWHVSLAEQVAIFLHYVRRGLFNRVLQERFQCSWDTFMKWVLYHSLGSCWPNT